MTAASELWVGGELAGTEVFALRVRVPVDRDHRFRSIVIIDSGDHDHVGKDGVLVVR